MSVAVVDAHMTSAPSAEARSGAVTVGYAVSG